MPCSLRRCKHLKVVAMLQKRGNVADLPNNLKLGIADQNPGTQMYIGASSLHQLPVNVVVTVQKDLWLNDGYKTSRLSDGSISG